MALVEQIRNAPSITLHPQTFVQVTIAIVLIVFLGLPALCAPAHTAKSNLDWHGNAASAPLPN